MANDIAQETCSCFAVDVQNDINPQKTEPDHCHPLLDFPKRIAEAMTRLENISVLIV